jgi:hypothetical protein
VLHALYLHVASLLFWQLFDKLSNLGNFSISALSQTAASTNNQQQQWSISRALPPDLQKSNSDILIYHAYEDREIACEIRYKLENEMKKLRMPTDEIETVRIHILDDFQSEGVPQAQLEAALKLASVKLLLVTRRFVQLKNTLTHPLEIFSILERSCSGQVFALRYDPDFNSYLRELDFYVQSLVQGCFYDPRCGDFVNKMSDLFKRHLMSRIARDAELNRKQEHDKYVEEQIRKIKDKQAGLKLRKERTEIEQKLSDPNITVEEMDRLMERLQNMDIKM